MNPTTESSRSTRNPETRHSFWTPLLAAGLLCTATFAVYEYGQIRGLDGHVATVEQKLAELKTASDNDANLQREQLDRVRAAITAQQDATGTAISKARGEAQRKAEAMVGQLRNQQSTHDAAVDDELSQVKQSASQTSDKLNGVQGDVASVREDVASAKSEIAKSVGDLQSVRGDMGVMSGLIATNSKEIEMLRKLGDRTIAEFNLSKQDGMVRVGDIQMRLTRAVPKRNVYSVQVSADDKVIEKRDKTTNEPVQFYVASKAQQPYEIVVNQVTKQAIKGYLAAPKVQTARN